MSEAQTDAGDGPHSAPGLKALRLDQSFLKTRRGIVLGIELLLMFVMFICYAASTAAFVAAPLIFLIVNLLFLMVYMSRSQDKLTGLSWPCMDFLRASCSALIFLILSITSAARSKEGGSTAALFGFILTVVLVYDAYDLYRTFTSDLNPRTEGAGESQSSNVDAD